MSFSKEEIDMFEKIGELSINEVNLLRLKLLSIKKNIDESVEILDRYSLNSHRLSSKSDTDFIVNERAILQGKEIISNQSDHDWENISEDDILEDMDDLDASSDNQKQELVILFQEGMDRLKNIIGER